MAHKCPVALDVCFIYLFICLLACLLTYLLLGPILQMTTGHNQQGLNWSSYFEAFPSPTRPKLAESARATVKGLTLFWGRSLKPVAAKKHLPSRLRGLRAATQQKPGYRG